MCRFALYMGPEIKMSSLVTEPSHSIVIQSYRSEERAEPLNGDGFGVAWYPAEENSLPGTFRSLSPAWNNRNLISISNVIHSHCILAHVRAASPGLPVTQLNCHPFTHGQLSFMHNGGIGKFALVKRKLSALLSDTSYNAIEGTTDSEYIFGLFMDEFASTQRERAVDRIAIALLTTIGRILSLLKSTGHDSPCDLNLVVTDGRAAVISRYSSEGAKPNSLHLHTGHRYSCAAGDAKLTPCEAPTVLVASEPLTPDSSWASVAANHMVLIDESLGVDIQPMVIDDVAIQ